MRGRGFAEWAVLAVMGAVLMGCHFPSTRFVSGLSAEERALAARLPVHRERLPEGSYQLIGPVEGLSCQITFDEKTRISKEHAIEELQRASVSAGGDAVMEVSCEHFGRRQGTRSCYRSIVCQGMAVQTTGLSAD